MQLHNLYPFPEERKTRRRVGRGAGSGLGCTSGKGHKGQNARAGGGVRPGFEGGQMPLYRRIPKRGFNNRFRKEYVVANISCFENFDANTEITLELLLEKGIVSDVKGNAGLKVLGDGALTKPMKVKAAKFSETAKTKIEAVGGVCEII